MKSGLRRSSRYHVAADADGVVTSEVPLRRGRSNTRSPYRRSTSPSYDRTHTRKRTNTCSSGNGDRRTANKICRVCGDKAFSYNFNVITCESCKAFFRRNANKEKDIRCPFSENCEINVVSRRFCQRCRLAKCFDVGMKKEWIMSDEARLEKKQRVEENRERRMLDALRTEGNMETSPRRERYKSESKYYDDQPSPAQPMSNYMPDYPQEMMAPFSVDPGRPPVSISPVCAMAAIGSHNIVDSIPTTAANSLADVSSTTSAVQVMDVDPASTMSGMGFIPPQIENSIPSTLSVLGNPVVSGVAVESAVIAAQAQLVHQQVQAAINQQQIVAAVVANQVAQLQNPAPISTPLQSSGIAPAIAAPLPAPTALQAPLLPPALAPPSAPLLLNNPLHQDMVTIPRDVLLHLIENNTKRTTSCTCKCMCGRYPHGATIVDEVTKDLLAVGQNASCNSCDQKDEAKLETAEDFQRNGLLPSDDSCVNWLNTQPNVVDPSALSDNSTLPPVEPYQAQSDGVQMVQMSDTDPEIHSLTNLDNDVLQAVEATRCEWGNAYDSYSYNCYELFRIDYIVKELLSAARSVIYFMNIHPHDQRLLIRERCLSYMIVRSSQLYDRRMNQWRGSDLPQSLDVQQECFRFYSQVPEDILGSVQIITVLSLIALFDPEANCISKEDVAREQGRLIGLLKRLLYGHYEENETRVREVCTRLLKLLPMVRDLAARCGPAFHYDPHRVDVIMAQS